MLVNPKKFYAACYGAFAVANLLSFLVFFIPYYVIEGDIGYFEYVRLFINKLVEFTLPSVAAVLVFLGHPEAKTKKTLVRGIGFALTRMIYLLPYYYLYYIAYGYDSIEAISLSALVTVFGALLFWAHIALLFLVIKVAAVRIASRSLPPVPSETKKERLSRAEAILPQLFFERGAFDLSRAVNTGIFASVFLQFIINLIRELVDTVIYLVDYAGSYRESEIIYITLSYVFLIIELLAVHALCYMIKQLANHNKTNIKETK